MQGWREVSVSSSMPKEWMRGPQWASAKSRAEWEPVLRAARQAWLELETLSVSAGIRKSALQYVTPKELLSASGDCAEQGFAIVLHLGRLFALQRLTIQPVLDGAGTGGGRGEKSLKEQSSEENALAVSLLINGL